MTFIELMELFPTEKSVIDYYLKIRYPHGVRCNHCGSDKVYQEKKRRKVFSCNDCLSTFSPFKDTIFEKSSTDLRKWMYAIHLFLNGRKGISGLQLQREIGVTYKTAWRMLQQIRLAMGNSEQKEFFDTIVEIDETYIGGKPRKDNEHDDNNDKSSNKRGRGTDKTPVVGIVDRNNKQVYAKVAMPNADGKKLTAKQLMDILNKVSKQENNNVIMTDEFRSYSALEKHNYIHLRVDHTKAFSNYNGTHTNTIESFWATLKRGVYGIYHHISVEYMQRYVDEFCFRYNNRGYNMLDIVLRQSVL
jgi:transposase-like protein